MKVQKESYSLLNDILDNTFQPFYKQDMMIMIYQTINYPTNQFLQTTK